MLDAIFCGIDVLTFQTTQLKVWTGERATSRSTVYLPFPVCDGTIHTSSLRSILSREAMSLPFCSRIFMASHLLLVYSYCRYVNRKFLDMNFPAYLTRYS